MENEQIDLSISNCQFSQNQKTIEFTKLENCEGANCRDYVGKQSKSNSGKECLKWEDHTEYFTGYDVSNLYDG